MLNKSKYILDLRFFNIVTLCLDNSFAHSWQWTLDRWKSVHLVFVRRRVGERMIAACVDPTIKHGRGGVMVWGCFAGDTLSDLFRIQGTLNQHGYHSILQRYAIPSGLSLVGQSFVLQQDTDPTHLQSM